MTVERNMREEVQIGILKKGRDIEKLLLNKGNYLYLGKQRIIVHCKVKTKNKK